MKLELIPALEISPPAIDWQLVGPHPIGHFWQNPLDWDNYQAHVLQVAGLADYKRVIKGSHFLSLDNWSLSDLRSIIRWHLGPEDNDIPAAESCALFGGGVLFVDDNPVLVPQCCSTLADLHSWSTLLEPQFQSGHFCLEGHPCPKATRQGHTVHIACHDKYEDFNQPAKAEFSLEIAALATAVSAAEEALAIFCEKVDRLSAEFGVQRLSDHLVRGK